MQSIVHRFGIEHASLCKLHWKHVHAGMPWPCNSCNSIVTICSCLMSVCA